MQRFFFVCIFFLFHVAQKIWHINSHLLSPAFAQEWHHRGRLSGNKCAAFTHILLWCIIHVWRYAVLQYSRLPTVFYLSRTPSYFFVLFPLSCSLFFLRTLCFYTFYFLMSPNFQFLLLFPFSLHPHYFLFFSIHHLFTPPSSWAFPSLLSSSSLSS